MSFGLFFVFLGFFLMIRLCCIRRSAMKHPQKSGCESDVPCFSRGYRKCMRVHSEFECVGLRNLNMIQIHNNVWWDRQCFVCGSM